MTRQTRMHRSHGPATVAFALLLILASTGCASAPPASSPPDQPAGEGTEVGPSAESPGDAEEGAPAEADAKGERSSWAPARAQPPDGEWLVDEEGRQYFVRELPKYEGYYRWIDENRVQIAGGVTFYVEDHDEDTLYARVYRVERRPSRRAAETPAQEEPRGVEQPAPSSVDLSASDRLRFQPFDDGLPTRGQWRNGFAIADMNGDGHPDIVHGPPRKGNERPAIFLGDGAGHWRRWREARFRGAHLDYGDVAVADFDGDGLQDVAFAVHLRGIKVFVARGGGSFVEWSEGIGYSVRGGAPALFSSVAIEAADWNRDGLPDLVVLGEGPRMGPAVEEADSSFRSGAQGVVVFLNAGDGTWSTLRPLEEGEDSPFGDALVLADFDADGAPDFATATRTAGRRNIVGLGEGDAGWTRVRIPELPENAYVWNLATSDFDGDGRSDLAISYLQRQEGSWFSGIDVLLNRDEGWLRQPLHREEGRDVFAAVGTGDLDGDGQPDLVAFRQSGEGWVALGQGDGTFVREASPELTGPEQGCAGFEVTLVDLDGSGGDEVVAGFAGEPGGEIIFGSTPSCMGGGSLEAWRAAPSRSAQPSTP